MLTGVVRERYPIYYKYRYRWMIFPEKNEGGDLPPSGMPAGIDEQTSLQASLMVEEEEKRK